MMGDTSPKSPKSGLKDSPIRRPSVSTENTRIYPVRSLLADIQPDEQVATPTPSRQSSIHKNPFFPPFSTLDPRKLSASQADSLELLNSEPEPSHPSPHSPEYSSRRASVDPDNTTDTIRLITKTSSTGLSSANTPPTPNNAPGLGAGHYVHLPPMPSSNSTSGTTQSSMNSHNAPFVASYSTQALPRGARPSSEAPSNASHPSYADQSGSAEQSWRTDDSSDSSVLVRDSCRSVYSVRSSANSSMHVTHRFKHVQTEHGHHISIGREGELKRCEDEPIRTPGTVQAFGVLIALEEDYETGNLVVCQVSENSTEILGLTPQFLFRLECFSHTLPQDQADVLWDNIQYPSEPEEDPPFNGTSEDSPQVFLLSGWGESGSVVQDFSNNGSSTDTSTETSGSNTDTNRKLSSRSRPGTTFERRPWTCWVAAHRLKRAVASPMPADAKLQKNDANPDSNSNPIFSRDGLKGSSPLIILEFELVKDIHNPIYRVPEPKTDLGTVSPVQKSGGSFGFSSSIDFHGSDNTMMQGHDASSRYDGFKSATPTQMLAMDKKHHPDDETSTLHASLAVTLALALGANNRGLVGDEDWTPSPEHILQSTTNRARPIKTLERMRHLERAASHRQDQRSLHHASVNALSSSSSSQPANFARNQDKPGRDHGGRLNTGTLDVFAVLAQVNEQLDNARDLPTFLDVVVGVIKDLTQFHRVLIYQFDERLNGQVVAELVDWRQTHDLYKGLHFPAADIPAQARELYKINKVRSIYDRGQVTARLVGRTKEYVETPLDLTHSYLRATSPIHLKYLANMGVRGSMSISIVCFGELWGLVCCHSYGEHGMRVSFPVRQMLCLLSDTISRNVERLSYAQRLHTRQLISTMPTDAHPTGYIVSNAEDLIELFDADFGILAIGEGAKILGPNNHGQDILIAAEYLRRKQFKIMLISQQVACDFPDMNLPSGLNAIAGLLYVPLSPGGQDFIAFLRKGQLHEVTWAGRPFKDADQKSCLEPRSSFKAWSETVQGRSRGVLALIYGKFIDVWREKETTVKPTQLTNLLLSNANREVRTPLNHIIHYLELALNSSLDNETRESLNGSHAASKSLLFTINDLLDLTRLESGGETSFNDPFDLHATIEEAVQTYRSESARRQIAFEVRTEQIPRMVIGDSRKIRTVIANLTANAVKFTERGSITVECQTFEEPDGLRGDNQVVIETTISDTGCGIDSSRIESIFREFEQVEQVKHASSGSIPQSGLGLGLAVCGRIIKQLGGQLRVDSKPGQGSRFSFLIPFMLPGSNGANHWTDSSGSSVNSSPKVCTPPGRGSEIDSLVGALSSSPVRSDSANSKEKAVDRRTEVNSENMRARANRRAHQHGSGGEFEVEDSMPLNRNIKVDQFDLYSSPSPSHIPSECGSPESPMPAKPPLTAFSFRPPPREEKCLPSRPIPESPAAASSGLGSALRVLIVDDERVNRTILSKRLMLDGHQVVTATNGQEAVDLIESDPAFDCILMDIQMPLKNGFEASAAIRVFEKANPLPINVLRPSVSMNGRIPIFAVSASLQAEQRDFMTNHGIDGWILKPIDFKRIRVLLAGVADVEQRKQDVYYEGCNWERGGWMTPAVQAVFELPPSV